MSQMKEPLGTKRTLAYCVGDVANIFTNLLISSFLLIFYTDVFGITPAAAATLFLVARVWDAVNDPIIGIMVDKTNTRWGRFRPWVAFAAMPCAVMTVACFTVPMDNMSEAAKLIYAYVTYIGYGMCYTAVSVPYLSMVAVLTEDSQERTKMLGLRAILTAIPMILAAFVPMILESVGYEFGFKIVAIAASGIALALWIICVHYSKERVDLSKAIPQGEENKLTFKKLLNYLNKNRPFLVVCIMIATQFGYQAVTAGTGMYVAIYYLEMPELMTPMMLAAILPAMIGVVIARKLVNKYDKKWIFVVGMAICSFRSLFILSFDPTIILVSAAIASIFQGMAMSLTWSFLPDTIENGELKTGLRIDGLSTAIVGFFYKIGFALGGVVPGLILSIYGYVPNEVQSAETRIGLELLGVYIPMLLAIINAGSMMFYSITKEQQADTIKKLHVIREKAKKEKAGEIEIGGHVNA